MKLSDPQKDLMLGAVFLDVVIRPSNAVIVLDTDEHQFVDEVEIERGEVDELIASELIELQDSITPDKWVIVTNKGLKLLKDAAPYAMIRLDEDKE